ncbi:MAG: TetR/AcrR family transcriptional regulator [bacterium]|jgi:AcrR family transcriptional regulator
MIDGSARKTAAGRRQRERATRRKEIIDAAQELFFSKGFENTTMDEIAERAEFGKPTLYAYFKSKEEILFHVHMRGHAIKMDMLNQAIAKGRNGYERFRAMGYAYFEFYLENPEYLRIQSHWDYQGYDFDKFSDAVSRSYRDWHDSFKRLCDVYQDGIADGSLRGDVDVDRTVDLFFMTLRLAANQVLLIKNPDISQVDDTDEGLYFDYLKLFLRAIRPDTGKESE